MALKINLNRIFQKRMIKETNTMLKILNKYSPDSKRNYDWPKVECSNIIKERQTRELNDVWISVKKIYIHECTGDDNIRTIQLPHCSHILEAHYCLHVHNALTWLDSAGEGWGRLNKAPGPGQAWTHPLALIEHSTTGTLLAIPWKCCFGHFWALHIWTHILIKCHILQFLSSFDSFSSFNSFGISGPTLGAKMSQGLLGLCCLM